jgi:hypothetical protein
LQSSMKRGNWRRHMLTGQEQLLPCITGEMMTLFIYLM